MDQAWHLMECPCIEMTVIYRTVFGLLLLMHQCSSVALPGTIKSTYILPQPTEEWKYPYSKDSKCNFPYIWQAIVGRCCYPVFNCKPGHGIEFCSVDRGNDSCVECKDSFKQYHLVHSFDGKSATCFHVGKHDEDECIVAIKGETLPARGNHVASCGLPCVCNSSNCFYGDDPCRCLLQQGKCKSNQQMNRLTGVCEACPWYSYKPNVGCDACLVNESLWMSGPSIATAAPPSTPEVTAGVNITGYLPDSTTVDTSTMKTISLLPLLPDAKNDTPNQAGLIIGIVMGVLILVGAVVIAAVCVHKRRLGYARSGTSNQYPPILVLNHEPVNVNQGERETLLPHSPENNIQESNGHIGGQLVPSIYHHHMESLKPSESGNHVGIHLHRNERNQSASANIESKQENPAKQMEKNHSNNNIEPSNDLAMSPTERYMTCSGSQKVLAGTVLVDLQTSSNVVQIACHETDNQNKGRDIVNVNQNIVHAETTDPPSSILVSSDSNNPCSSSQEMEKNLDGKIKLQLRKDIEVSYSGGIIQFTRGSPVENSDSWTYPRESAADSSLVPVVQTLSDYENGAQNTVPQAISTSDVDKRAVVNISKIPVKEFMEITPCSINPDPETPILESRIFSEDSGIHSEEGHPQSSQHLTMPHSSTSASNSSTFGHILNRSVPSSTEDEDGSQNSVPQALCNEDVDKRTDDDNIGKIPAKEVVRVPPLYSSADRGLCLRTLSQDSGTCNENSGILNEEARQHTEEGHPQSPQHFPSNSSTFRPFSNRSTSVIDRPTAKVTPMRQESQRQDGVTAENDDNMSTDSSTDISMSYGVIHISGDASIRDESLESTNPSLSSFCEDADPPSFALVTHSSSTASYTQMENTRPGRTSFSRPANRNGSQSQMNVNQSRGGPDGASVSSHHQANRVMEPRQVCETEVKESQQSEETDPKTLLRSTPERDTDELESQGSDSEGAAMKIGFKVDLPEDLEKLRNICEGLVYPIGLSNVAENSSVEVQGKTSRKDFDAMGANASPIEINLRNVPLHDDDEAQYNKWSLSSELEEKEIKLNSVTRSKLDTEENNDSYGDREDLQIETVSVEESGMDGTFQDSKSSFEETEKESKDLSSDRDHVLEESSSDQSSSHSDDDGVSSNGDAEVEQNRELQQINVHNEFNSSSLSVNSDESGIEIEEKNIQHLQDS